MRDKLRRRYQVYKEVNQNGYFEGEIALSELTRLQDILHPEQADADARRIAVKFDFVRNEYDIPMLTGQLETSLTLECQRCLQPLEMPLSLSFKLMVDASDDIVRLSSVETLYSDEGYIDINDVVEDELILAIPLVVLHPDPACNEYMPVAAQVADEPVKENPFAVLQQLKTTE